MQEDASATTEETCTQYNLLKLARNLFTHTGDPGASWQLAPMALMRLLCSLSPVTLSCPHLQPWPTCMSGPSSMA